jgi:glucosamine--fructose-6-phosphate aminotransferase (isomerizing)
MIKEIPEGFRATLKAVSSFRAEPTEQLVFTGNGTAWYSAWMGAQVLNLSDRDWAAIQGFELAHYASPGARKKTTVVGVSHSGITKSTMDALSKEKSLGARTIGVTHFPDRPISKLCDTTLVVGNSPDKSRCHTKAYTDSAAAVFALALKYSDSEGELQEVRKTFETNLADQIEATISNTEQLAKKAASELRNVSRIFFSGAGPNLVTARESALKIKEACYLAAEGMELEEIQHGPAMSFNEETLVMVFAPSGPSVERAKDLLAASKQIGATTMVVSDLSDFRADYSFRINRTHEYLSPFLSIIPPYLFSYYLSVEQGKNPDYIHYLDPKYWGARTIIFPLGTH